MAEFQMASTPGRSRFSKALPAPPSGLLQVESVTRGKTSPFPSGQRGKTSPFPSPRPPVTPSKTPLPRTPVSGISNESVPITDRALLTPLQSKTSLPRTPASESSNQLFLTKESVLYTPPPLSKASLPRTPASGSSNQSTSIKETALSTSPLPTPLRITIPKTYTKMPIQIPRRPVGAGAGAGAGAGTGAGTALEDSQKDNNRESVASVSSIYSEYGRPRSSTGGSYVTKDSSVASDHDDNLPAPPPKDPRRTDRASQDKPTTPKRLHSDSVSSSSSVSPGRPELWRRRSIKGEQRVNIAGLKLTKSNGFTESPTAVNNTSPVAQQSQKPPPPAAFQLPRSQGNHPGLPGRNIRKPVPARAAPPQPTKASASVVALTQAKQQTTAANLTQANNPPPAELEEDMPPVLNKIKGALGMKREEPPLSSPERVEELREIVSGINFPNYTDRHLPQSQPGLPTLHQTNLIPQGALEPSPVSPVSPQLPLETLSHSESQSTIKPIQEENPGATAIHSYNTSDELAAQSLASEALVETTRKILSRIPALFNSAPGNVSPPYALQRSHFDCYARHQKLHEHRNKTHPVSCQICLKKDTERRFVCTFCSVRCCNVCHEMLRWDRTGNPERDLAVVLRALGRPDSTMST